MQQAISIVSISSLSALGSSSEAISEAYKSNNHFLSEREFDGQKTCVAQLNSKDKKAIQELKVSNKKYNNLDKTVLYGIFTARKAIEKANWNLENNFGVNIGSSRGATELFEKHHSFYLKNNKSNTLSSPTTTLGNISSWIAHDLQTNGPEISHSITCSTGLHSVLNGVAWINSGMTDKFLVGASEAPLTEFTIAQLKALKIYTKQNKNKYPCKALDLNKTSNTMVLGEASTMLCLEKGNVKNRIASIVGIGYATEILEHNTSISSDANCLKKSMLMAIGKHNIKEIDAVVMHAPGTIKGDLSEYQAIKSIFSENMPFLTTNKWKLGHTFATSGILNIEMGIEMIKNNKTIPVPYINNKIINKNIKKVLINAVGFGGNAVSILISK